MTKPLKIFLLISLTWCIILTGCSNSTSTSYKDKNSKPVIAVSIVPEETFVKAVAGNLVDIVTMIPPGKSPTNYQPTPELLEDFSDASIYFTIGVPTEKDNILPKAKDFNKNLKIIDLSKKVSGTYKDRKFTSGGRDPHIWLSPKRVEIMINSIKDELSNIDPQNKDIYSKNAKAYIKNLNTLDKNIKTTLNNVVNKTFIIYHPSLGYFADDYGLNMLTLEQNGKEATPQDMQNLINKAKQNNIKVIFYQAEVDSKQCSAFAESINGETEKVNPLDGNYIENMKKIAHTFSKTIK
ncbi:metal ABC transporter solute-binding protein, Zn/Mn family [Haloimpatiens sp. FM7330]|uniref:metal ABC transporter solute-binding protein, Zn/Mn family n=1 Tax=Haloimpatiens sp. FM7330 TaxID=3298610 RepID=UPI0036325CA7